MKKEKKTGFLYRYRLFLAFGRISRPVPYDFRHTLPLQRQERLFLFRADGGA